MSGHHPESRQRGIVLITCLLVIAVVTLLSVASLNLTDNALLVVGNEQARQRAESVADQVAETTLNDLNNFTTPAALPAGSTRNGLAVSRTAPACVGETTMSGFSLNNPLSFQRNYYSFRATASDPGSGAASATDVGIRIVMNADTCNP